VNRTFFVMSAPARSVAGRTRARSLPAQESMQ
jgi:hypothetical protein